MNVTRDDIARVEQRLEFDPSALKRALLDRTPIANAPPEVVRRRLVHALSEGSDASELAVDRVLTGAQAYAFDHGHLFPLLIEELYHHITAVGEHEGNSGAAFVRVREVLAELELAGGLGF